MVFSDLIFIFGFLPVTLAIYYAVPFKAKNYVLFVSGIVFYAWGEPVYVLAMIASTMIDYFAGRVMNRFDSKPSVRRAALIVSVVMNLSLLGVFKYSGFFVEAFNSVTGLALPVPALPLPIGISFFTFQSMSYTIDLYRREISVQKNPVKFAAFVTMFPQIVAGPIVRYSDVARELSSRTVDFSGISDGIGLFVCGLAKKVLVANTVGGLWDAVKASDYSSISAAYAWLGIAAFTLQIYFDFSGYSDMAVGLGRMLGFNFPKNFDYPYVSVSVSEFWRRWHITLGSWFKSYVYFPLGGNRRGTARTVFNLSVVWLLTGLWHGASMNFVLWGIYYGALIILEKFVLAKLLPRIPVPVRRTATLLAVVLGWVIFEISSPSDEISFISALLGLGGAFFDTSAFAAVHNYIFVFAVGAAVASGLPMKLWKKLSERFEKGAEIISFAAELAVFLLCVSYLVDAGYNPFLYFNF